MMDMSGLSNTIVAAANSELPDGYIIDYDIQPSSQWSFPLHPERYIVLLNIFTHFQRSCCTCVSFRLNNNAGEMKRLVGSPSPSMYTRAEIAMNNMKVHPLLPRPSSSSPSSSTRLWSLISGDVWRQILQSFSPRRVSQLAYVCRQWSLIMRDDRIWSIWWHHATGVAVPRSLSSVQLRTLVMA
jgi:hypothetical protein